MSFKVYDSKNNCFVSPLSIYCSLSLALSGSSDRSHHEVAQVLNVHKQQFKDYDSTLTHLGSRLDSVFAGDTGESLVNRFFNEALEKHFHAESHMVNFASNAEEARKQINVWVSDHTCKKISDLMTQNSIDSRTRLVLGNAIYFKGGLSPRSNNGLPFPSPYDGEVQVPMMSNNGVYEMSRFDEFSATTLKIPFKLTTRCLSCYPTQMLLELMEKIFDPYRFSHFKELFDKSKYESNRVELHLPKFKLGGGESQNIKKPLSAMGLETIFNHLASPKRKSCTSRVNEAGAEAAAATGMAVTPMCMCSDFTVDHPFLFFIVTETGVPAFMDHVINPLA
uniref:Serpin domain-containing protein n=1 Tax=Echinococcus canadensis TaxID=519352 RepID=A0A915EXI3_9CEST